MADTITKTADVTVSNQGSLIMLSIITPEAKAWVEENVQTETWQWLGNNLCVEPRYADNVIDGMQADGLSVE